MGAISIVLLVLVVGGFLAFIINLIIRSVKYKEERKNEDNKTKEEIEKILDEENTKWEDEK